MKPISRRRFVQASVASATALGLRGVPAWAVNARTSSAAMAVVPPLSQFAYSDVQLLDGPLRRQFDENHHLFLNLNEDALLKPFRQREGLPAPGPDMGGWYDNSNDFDADQNFHGFVPGHSFGQYLSALARACAITGSKATQEKVHRLVLAFAKTVSPEGKFYEGYHLPAYTYDKTSCGLIDAHEFANCPDALDVHWRATRAAVPHLPEKALSRAEQRARPHKMVADTWDETYTLPENFLLAYQRSGRREYRELGLRFVEEDYFGPLAEGNNVLPGEHAYSHVNAFSSAMQAYFATGSDKYLRAAKNGFRMVEDQSYATGGWGPNEAFVEPGKGQLAESLKSTHSSFETPCGAYGHFKITRYLLRTTRDSHYGDSMERILYNTIAGAIPISPDGTSFYYSDYNEQGRKGHHRDKWPCCSGTFPQLTADYGISSYFRDKDGIYVNLFIPSAVSWSQNGTHCSLRQTTDYPRQNTSRIEFKLAKPETFTVYLRIPAWAGPKTSVSVNSRRADAPIQPGKFVALRRNWNDKDRIEFEIEMPMRLEAVDDRNPDLVALLRGPLALFAVGKTPQRITRQQLLGAGISAQSSDDWIANTDDGPLILRPFPAIMDETYRLYQHVEA